ncbi:hypothetical protein PI124_g17269 [Phytophthora idaei]|nr:hypothetical protein PI125_g1015 [Phytophthora idaei]KAG3139201.1 hypothetical protein PI126_g16553 [Phytophthora idaei]KAG3237743.1 hypothetical protein PI124_g17269 [Phytophthora idaei]
MAQTSVHVHVRAMAKHNGVPVILHSDHCAKKLLPWFNGIGEETLVAKEKLIASEDPCSSVMAPATAQEIQTAMDIDTGKERNGLHNLYEEKGYLQVQIGTYKKYYDLCV